MRKILLLSVLAIILTGCADVQHGIEQCLTGHQYGFWGGLWHGIISPISFIGSLFSNEIDVFAINNNGGWYNFGFIWGATMSVGGGATYTSRK